MHGDLSKDSIHTEIVFCRCKCLFEHSHQWYSVASCYALRTLVGPKSTAVIKKMNTFLFYESDISEVRDIHAAEEWFKIHLKYSELVSIWERQCFVISEHKFWSKPL